MRASNNVILQVRGVSGLLSQMNRFQCYVNQTIDIDSNSKAFCNYIVFRKHRHEMQVKGGFLQKYTYHKNNCHAE